MYLSAVLDFQIILNGIYRVALFSRRSKHRVVYPRERKMILTDVKMLTAYLDFFGEKLRALSARGVFPFSFSLLL